LKITAQFSIVIAAIFASICFGVALTGFNSLGNITDPVLLADAKGFAWFWVFLGSVGIAFCAIGIWLVRTQKEGDEG
jgi:hypothetical protein